MSTLSQFVYKHWGGIVILSLIGAVAALGLSLQQTPLYASSARILVTQRQTSGMDAYTAARGSEKLAQNLTTIIGTASFLERVLGAGFSVTNDFPKDEARRRKAWQEVVKPSVVTGSSILAITVYHKNRDQAERILVAVNTVLVSQGTSYLGTGDNVILQIVDAPLTTTRPVKPNTLLNIAGGCIAGFIISLGYSFIREAIANSFHGPRTLSSLEEAQYTSLPTGYLTPKQQETVLPSTDISAQELRANPYVVEMSESLPAQASQWEESLDSPETLPAVPPVACEVHGMHDHIKTPLSGQYYFQNRLIGLES
ncbi:MAG: GNVR domain-containing protein [Patescibacteria group bacterium]